jgi:hypothetical protein
MRKNDIQGRWKWKEKEKEDEIEGNLGVEILFDLRLCRLQHMTSQFEFQEVNDSGLGNDSRLH